MYSDVCDASKNSLGDPLNHQEQELDNDRTRETEQGESDLENDGRQEQGMFWRLKLFEDREEKTDEKCG